jgi:DNA repair exonuclease SbcCD ATPase subunit
LANVVHDLQRLTDAEHRFAVAERNEHLAQNKVNDLIARQQQLTTTIGSAGKTGSATKIWADALERLLELETRHQARIGGEHEASVAANAAESKLRDFFTRFDWPVDGEPSVARTGFEEWFDRTETLMAAERELEAAKANVQRLDSEIASNSRALRDLFREYAFACPEHPCDGVAPFRAWFEASRRLETERQNVQNARRTLVAALRHCGVPDRLPNENRPARLEDRAEVPVCRNEAAQQLRQWMLNWNDSRVQARALRGMENWPEAFARLSLVPLPTETEVRAKREHLARIAAGEDDLNKAIIETETTLREAESRNDLAKIEQGMAKAVSAMDEWLARTLDGLASQSVIDHITEVVRKEATPAIIEKANCRLEALTGGRYTGLDVNDAEVTVVDGVEKDRPKKVNQLSTGTRAHLALAVRLAVIETSEVAGYRFPLFLDEIMATSDPDASSAIASAVRQIAEERQVVLFTNQPDDLAVLYRACGQDLPLIQLGHAPLPASAPPETAPPAAPLVRAEGLPITSSINQWSPELLRTIVPELDAAARTVYEATMHLEAEQRPRIEAILRALEAVRAAVAKAHQRLQWADIETADWITTNFRDRAQQALEESKGNPRQFIEQFRQMKGMRDVNKQNCETWLESQGYLTEPPSLLLLRDIAHDKLPQDWPGRTMTALGLASFFAEYASR